MTVSGSGAGDESLEVLLEEQRRQWESGERPRVESFVTRVPNLADDHERLLDLIYQEVVLREQAGEAPQLAEYLGRFPALEEPLRLQFEVHEAIGSEAASAGRGISSFSTATATSGDEPFLSDEAVPEAFGRYRVVSRLGRGGFGDVFLGQDEELDRPVAIKVWRRPLSEQYERGRALIDEARKTARLQHRHIIAVYDVGWQDQRPYMVCQYIDGQSLSTRLRTGSLAPNEAVVLIAQVAEALAYAHRQGLIHQDVNPSNIMLDRNGQAYLGDFGLSSTPQDMNRGRGKIIGTPHYMSPEQVRGEQHRVDSRTDIYSLGAVLYQLLTDQPPFRGSSISELFDAIQFHPPEPLRQHVGELSPEIERICLKAMAKRPSDRYREASAMAEELSATLEPGGLESSEPPPLRLVGWQSYGTQDRDYFQRLLPGPHDRFGLAEVVTRWRDWVERTDGDAPVGLIYGPSGCGKSSLVHAGLLPHLASHVQAIHVDASRSGMTEQLQRQLSERFDGLPEGDLTETLQHVRQELAPGTGKLLLVIDQLEQYLAGRAELDDRDPLARALRQCDGRSIRALLVVRDDFWVATSHLFRTLEIPLIEDENARLVDAFDLSHARRVLLWFGQACGALPARENDLTEEQYWFLDEAVRELAENGRVQCVRLSAFVETMRRRPWTRSTLEALGGRGWGPAYLEEQLADPGSVTRQDQLDAARRVLEALLPPGTAMIRGPARSETDLRRASELEPAGFDELMRRLDQRLHLVTPVDEPEERHWRLTHDALVPAIREWLEVRGQRSWRTRSALTLQRRTRAWQAMGCRDRDLPWPGETLRLLLAVRAADRTPDQQRMLSRASRRSFRQLAVAVVLLLVVAAAIGQMRRAGWRREAVARVDSLVHAAPGGVPLAVRSLRDSRYPVRDLLRQAATSEPASSTAELHAWLGLAALGEVNQQALVDGMLDVPPTPSTCRNVVTALSLEDASLDYLRSRFSEFDEQGRRRAGIVLVHLGDPQPLADWLRVGGAEQRSLLLHEFPDWHADLQQIASVAAKSDDALLASTLVLGLGLIEPRRLETDSIRSLLETVRALYIESDLPGVHGAARWTLTQWNQQAAPVRVGTAARPDWNWFDNTVGITMVRVPTGSFEMGDPRGDFAARAPHRVTLTQPYWIADREVTVAQYAMFLEDRGEGAPPPQDPLVSPGPEWPVQRVAWEDAVLFCNWLSRREGREECYRRAEADVTIPPANGETETRSWTPWECDFEADGYRLPTEAEWEWACRAGTSTRYYFGEDDAFLRQYGRSTNNRKEPARRTGSLIPNAWGLFDTHGNVWEMCWDLYGEYATTPQVDPRGPAVVVDGVSRVIRGGGVGNSSGDPDVHSRGIFLPVGQHFWNVGFRVVCRDAAEG